MYCIDWIIPGSIKKALRWIFDKCKQSCKQQCSIKAHNHGGPVRYRPAVQEDYIAHIPLVEQRADPGIVILDQLESLPGPNASEEAETDFSRVLPNLKSNKTKKKDLPWHYTESDLGVLRLTSYLQVGGIYIPVYYDMSDGKIKDDNKGIYPNEIAPSTTVL